MFRVGDRVFHKGVEANGYIDDIDETKRAKYKVVFFWAHYCNVLHTPPRPKVKNPYSFKGYGNPANRKWQWSEEDSLVPGPAPYIGPQFHRLAMVNRRITDKRLNLVGEIPFARDEYADIYIRYGGNLNHNGGFCINEKIVLDKWDQMQMLGEDLVSRSVMDRTFDGPGWIIKPRRSCGGKNIKRADRNYARPGMDYYQEFFPKVKEYRVHCFLWLKDPVPFIQEKAIPDPNQLCWNKKQGGAFRYAYQPDLPYGKYNGTISKQNISVMRIMSVEALKRLKYDSGGVDIGMDAQGNFKIFEVNSAMGLRERSLYTYKKAYWELADLDIEEYRRTRWNG
jgi:hypothetical protein